MRIPIDRESEIPLYQQIQEFLRQGILSGSLSPETRLPSTRQLASDLGVNRITVENAYAILEADGLVLSRASSGTYVLPPANLPEITGREQGGDWPLWQQEIRSQYQSSLDENLEDALEAVQQPALVDLASGSGDARQFPVEDYRRVIQTVLRRDGIRALAYGENSGYKPLRVTIAQVLASQGVMAHPENILITAGSQQAIALVTQLLLQPGDAVVVESPTYAVALDLFRALHLKIIGVPTDENGMQVERLEKILQQQRPRLLYIIPNFQNPTGACLSVHRRRQLIALADRYNLPILEDDYVGDLRYEGRALPALKSLDPGGRVIYASTFSKMLMPGLRVGFLMADGPVYHSLVHYKHVNDLTTSNLHQRALEAYVTVGRYQAHLRRTCQLYRKRRDALLEAVNRYLPATVSASSPQGGLFLWLTLPEGVCASRLLPLALEEGVAFSPGKQFFPDPVTGDNYLRLNFASQPPELLVEGVKRLAKALKRYAATLA